MTNIQIEPTNKVLSANDGMILFEAMIEKLRLDKHISEVIPTTKKILPLIPIRNFTKF